MKHFLLFSTILLSISACKHTPVIKTDVEPHHRYDGGYIYKFNTLNEDQLIQHLENFIDTNAILLPEDSYQDLMDWIKNRVFSPRHASTDIVEWNINDEDICRDISLSSTITRMVDKRKLEFNTNVTICNSELRNDMSAGSFWDFDIPEIDASLWITFHTRFYKFHGHRGYYEVIKGEDGSFHESQFQKLGKFSGLTEVYFDYRRLTNRRRDYHTKIKKKVTTDESIVFSKNIHFEQEDFLNIESILSDSLTMFALPPLDSLSL